MIEYEYTDVPPDCKEPFKWMADKIDEALNHDPMVYRTSSVCKSMNLKHNSIEFYIMLSYYALKDRNALTKMLHEHTMKAINPPIVIQYGGEFIPEDLKDKLDKMNEVKKPWYKRLFKGREKA